MLPTASRPTATQWLRAIFLSQANFLFAYISGTLKGYTPCATVSGTTPRLHPLATVMISVNHVLSPTR